MTRVARRRKCAAGPTVRVAALLVLVTVLSQEAQVARSVQAKEFDWTDLGVSLARSAGGGGGLTSATGNSNGSSLIGNNLRILVSPQRRLAKNYEFEYSNSTNAVGSSAVADPSSSGASYALVANSSPYLSQSVYQLTPSNNHSVSSVGSSAAGSSQSSAYSALSASLASLKSRLSARGMTLTSLGANSVVDASGAPTAPSYSGSSAVLMDASSAAAAAAANQQQQQQQQQQQLSAVQQVAQQAPTATYLSVGGAQSGAPGEQLVQSAPSIYATHHHHQHHHPSADANKTIVLAIPAKINFLSGGHKSSVSQQQASSAAGAVVASEQPRLEYAPKQQIGLISTQEASSLDGGQLTSSTGLEQEHHQYVIVNSPASGQPAADHHSVAASLSASQPTGNVYSAAVYQQQPQLATVNSYAMKYLQSQPASVPGVQKVYSVVTAVTEQPPLLGPNTQTVYTASSGQQQAQQQPQYVIEQVTAQQPQQVFRCPDTCNSADPRWRKYTISRYRSCCSRSAHYDATLGAGHADETKQTDDAQYSYLYRRQRSRRQRRQRNRNAARYQSTQAPVASQPDEEQPAPGSEQLVESVPRNSGAGSASSTSGSLSSYALSSPMLSSSSASSRTRDEYPYMKYYAKQRYQSQAEAMGGSSGDGSQLNSAGREEQSTGASRYGAKESGRAYRRARSRDYLAQLQQEPSSSADAQMPPVGGESPPEEETVYVRQPELTQLGYGSGGGGVAAAAQSQSYGTNEYSVGGYSSLAQPSGAQQDAADPEAPAYDDPTNQDQEAKQQADQGSPDYPGAELDGGSDDQDQSEVYPSIPSSSKYASGGQRIRKRPNLAPPQAGVNKSRRRNKDSQMATKYYKQNKAARSKAKQSLNATDYESAQVGGDSYGQLSADHQQRLHSATDDGQQPAQMDSAGGYYPTANNKQETPSSYDGEQTMDKDSMMAKYNRAAMNESSAVANLSKTTMHLKEILSLLEKKAQLRSNDSSVFSSHSSANNNGSSNSYQQLTSTPSPLMLIPTTTTTTMYPYPSLFGGSSSFGSASASGLSSSDILGSDFGVLKSPYRLDPTSLATSLGSPSSMSGLSSSMFGPSPLGPSDSLSSLSSFHHYPGSLHPNKHLGSSLAMHGLGIGHHSAGGAHGHQRKRRPNKHASNTLRYNDLLFGPKGSHGLSSTQSLLHVAAKNRLLNPALYSAALSYPYLYRGTSPIITNPYPYKNIHKNPYSSLLSGSMTSKLAAAAAAAGPAGLYSDESRLHGLANLDPLSNVASSLRPSSQMRLRSKSPFVFQPQVLPIYTRHSILTPQLDAKA